MHKFINKEGNRSLSREYFTKEFPKGWEVEWKGNLLTQDPSGFIFHLYETIAEGNFLQYKISSSLGTLPLNIRVFDYLFHFYGHEDQGIWVEDFVLAQPPGTDIFIPRVKKPVPVQQFASLGSNVIIRLEEQKEDLRNRLPGNMVEHFKSAFEDENNISTQLVGLIRRERYSFYITNTASYRNWGILADRSELVSSERRPTLSQVEFEYKGKSGISSVNLLFQIEALQEMDRLGLSLIELFGVDRLTPTKLTKFEWIVKNSL